MDRVNKIQQNNLQSNQKVLPKCLEACPEHQTQILSAISLSNNGKNLIFKCNKCVQPSQIVEINEIAFPKDYYFISKAFPVISEDLRSKLSDSGQQKSPNISESLRQFFKNLRIQVNQQLDKLEEEVIRTAEQADSFKERLDKEYNRLSRKSELRDILFDNQGIAPKSEAVKQIIDDVMKDTSQIEQKLQDMIESQNESIHFLQLEKVISRLMKDMSTCLNGLIPVLKQDLTPAEEDSQKKSSNNIKISINKESTEKLRSEIICKIIEENEVINSIEMNLQQYSKLNEFIQILDEISWLTNLTHMDVNFSPLCTTNEKDMITSSIVSENNKLGEKGIQQISNKLAKLVTLTSLTLSFTSYGIDNEGIDHLSKAIAKLENLTNLHVHLANCSIRSYGILDLTNAIVQLSNLKSLTLDFYRNSLGKEGVQNISNAMINSKNITCLDLNLAVNSIGNEGANDLSNTIAQLNNLTEITLYLGQNSLNKDGARYLANAITPKQYLQRLFLDFSQNKIGDEGIKFFAYRIGQMNSLTSLTFKVDSNGVKQEGVQYLSLAIAKLKNLSCLSVNFSQNKIGIEGATYLAQALSKFKHLTNLAVSLSKTLIEKEGVLLLSNAISQLGSLTSLEIDISSNSFKVDAVKPVMNAVLQLKYNLLNFTYRLHTNEIGDEGAQNLYSSIAQMKNLENLTLELSQNNITEGKKGAFSIEFGKLNVQNKQYII